MDQNNEFGKILGNEDSIEQDILMRKLLDSSASDDLSLAVDGFAEFIERTEQLHSER